ncbi:DUF1120 domain-containing protein [Nocardia sp. NPDC060256]|uniref:DUF1120 domain-containing protein n=1 Tax=unclassified Nocardia TaxID=2637762 RepID=UPI003650AA40
MLSGAQAADQTTRGLITPSACEPSLSNGGVVDYGKISVKDLNPDSPTVLGQQMTSLSVTCDAATLIALESIDNRAYSAVEPGNYGLGLINETEKLGWYVVVLRNAVADGVEVLPITSDDQGDTWNFDAVWRAGRLLSVASMDDLSQPLRCRQLTVDLVLHTIIAPTNTLTLNDEVPIDGNVTLTVRYL